MMPVSKITRGIYEIKRLKKDGSIACEHVDCVVNALKNGEIFVMPVDAIYGLVGINRDDVVKTIKEIAGNREENFEFIISNFKMLEDIAYIDKSSYDFLRRLWPGEVTVQLKKRDCRHNSCVMMRMPRHKYLLDIINRVGMPLVYVPAKNCIKKMALNEKDIIRKFKNFCSLLIINEFNKTHTMPTIIDISCDALRIINEGRVNSEEIKSLYFLGNV